jgi:ferredoxin
VRIQIDADLCTGHGRCYALAPELFDCDDDGHGEVRAEFRGSDGGQFRSGVLDDAVLGKAKSAVDNCPEAAITFVDD